MKKLPVLLFASMIFTTAVYPMLLVQKALKSKKIPKQVSQKLVNHLMPVALTRQKIEQRKQVHQLANRRHFYTMSKVNSALGNFKWWNKMDAEDQVRFVGNSMFALATLSVGSAILAADAFSGGGTDATIIHEITGNIGAKWFFMQAAFPTLNLLIKKDSPLKLLINIGPIMSSIVFSATGLVNVYEGVVDANSLFMFLKGSMMLGTGFLSTVWHAYEFCGPIEAAKFEEDKNNENTNKK
jgi:hypothetical protein